MFCSAGCKGSVGPGQSAVEGTRVSDNHIRLGQIDRESKAEECHDAENDDSRYTKYICRNAIPPMFLIPCTYMHTKMRVISFFMHIVVYLRTQQFKYFEMEMAEQDYDLLCIIDNSTFYIINH